jgi:hypothetical protein
MGMADLLQLFRQQLLVTDYAHVRDYCDLPRLADAIDGWRADRSGHARKATATTALFAMTDSERAKHRSSWESAFASTHPQVAPPARMTHTTHDTL